jgi:large conductance mechanosensitive channel
MIAEFKKFISQGNVIDLAVGLIIGVAFGKIVSSFVGDLLMPLFGILLGGIDFTSLGIVIKEATDGKEPVIFAYGKFIQSVIDFLIIAAAIFLMVKAINKFRSKEEAAPPPPPPAEDVVLLTEIRDLLKQQK